MSEKNPSDLINDFFYELKNGENLDLRKALAGDYSGVGKFSPIGQEFLDDNEFLFSKVLPSVVHLLEHGALGKELVEFEKQKLEVKINEHYVNSLNNSFNQKQEAILIEFNEKNLKNLSFETLAENANAIYQSIILPFLKNPSKNQTEKNYFYTYLLGIAYEKFSRALSSEKKYNRTKPKENLIYQYYRNIDIDIEKTDQQFRKYDLFSVANDAEIFVARPSRIIDTKNNIQFIVEGQEALLQLLVDSKQRGYINDLALLARSQDPIESDQHIRILLGTDQVAVPPKIQNIFNDSFPHVFRDVIESQAVSEDELFSSEVIYKFHEIGYSDQVWVFSKDNSVVFEEILGDPEIFDDCVVTQMIHLEYELDDGRIKISHIDHEYLFYSYEEYDKRLVDYNQRAGAKKRIKTFKADRSKIPLVFEDGTFFLYAVLDAYFTKAYYLQEFLVRGCGLKDVAEMVKKIQGRKSNSHS